MGDRNFGSASFDAHPFFISESFFCGSQELRHDLGHVHLVHRGSAA